VTDLTTFHRFCQVRRHFSALRIEVSFLPRVIFKNTVVTAPFNKALWSIWNSGDPRTDNILFADYNSTGSGISGASRPAFATLLSASQAASYSISSALGSDYTTWVDMSYVV